MQHLGTFFLPLLLVTSFEQVVVGEAFSRPVPHSHHRHRGHRQAGATTTTTTDAAFCQSLSSFDRATVVSSCSSVTTLNLSGGGDDTAKPPSQPSLKKQLLAEFLGTFLLLHIGCGTVCAAIFTGAQIGLWQIAVAWALAVTVAITCTSSISGAHLNPAITFALALVRDFEWKKVVWYVLAQLAGAAMGGAVNFGLYSGMIEEFERKGGFVRGSLESVASAKAFGEYWSVSSWKTALLAEAIGTSILSFVIFSLTNARNKATNGESNSGGILVPSLIGGTVGMLISVFAPLTQAGFNPARDFGPRIVAACAGWGRGVAFQGWWVYVLGPMVGAPVGAWVADRLLYGEE